MKIDGVDVLQAVENDNENGENFNEHVCVICRGRVHGGNRLDQASTGAAWQGALWQSQNEAWQALDLCHDRRGCTGVNGFCLPGLNLPLHSARGHPCCPF